MPYILFCAPNCGDNCPQWFRDQIQKKCCLGVFIILLAGTVYYVYYLIDNKTNFKPKLVIADNFLSAANKWWINNES